MFTLSNQALVYHGDFRNKFDLIVNCYLKLRYGGLFEKNTQLILCVKKRDFNILKIVDNDA